MLLMHPALYTRETQNHPKGDDSVDFKGKKVVTKGCDQL